MAKSNQTVLSAHAGNALQITQQAGRVKFAGDLNRDQTPQAWANRRTWLPQEKNPVVLDLSGLKTVDSAGLAMFLQLKAELEQQGKTLELHQANRQLIAFAQVSGITEAFLNIQSVAEPS